MAQSLKPKPHKNSPFTSLPKYLLSWLNPALEETQRQSSTSPKPSKLHEAYPLVPEDYELTDNFVDRFILLEVLKVARRNQFLNEVEQKRQQLEKENLKLKEEKRRKKLKFHENMSFYSNNYFCIFVLCVIVLGGGMVVGINIPEGISCHSEHTVCWHLRWRNFKTVEGR